MGSNSTSVIYNCINQGTVLNFYLSFPICKVGMIAVHRTSEECGEDYISYHMLNTSDQCQAHGRCYIIFLQCSVGSSVICMFNTIKPHWLSSVQCFSSSQVLCRTSGSHRFYQRCSLRESVQSHQTEIASEKRNPLRGFQRETERLTIQYASPIGNVTRLIPMG